MDTMTLEPADILTTTAIEPVLRIAAGRLPVIAFVDADTERLLQESSLLPGRNQVIRGGIAKAIQYLSEQRSPHLLLVDISGVDLPLSQMQILQPAAHTACGNVHAESFCLFDLQIHRNGMRHCAYRSRDYKLIGPCGRPGARIHSGSTVARAHQKNWRK